MSTPGKQALVKFKRVQYRNEIKPKHGQEPKGVALTSYVDSDLAGDQDECYSTTEYISTSLKDLWTGDHRGNH